MSSTDIDVCVLGVRDTHGEMLTSLVDDVALHFTPVLRYLPWTQRENTILWTTSPSSCLMATRASNHGSS